MSSQAMLETAPNMRDDDWPPSFWDRFKGRMRTYRDDLVIIGFILLALLIFLLPLMVHTVPAGHVGVRWKRFLGGTEEGMPESEGTIFSWPWDKVLIYDLRIKQVERQIEVLSSDGLTIAVDLVWRYRLVRQSVGQLHKYVGPKYEEELLNPTVTARARDVFSVYRPDEIYTERRLVIQSTIARTVREELRNNFNPDPDPNSYQAKSDRRALKEEMNTLMKLDSDAAKARLEAAERAIEKQNEIDQRCSKLNPGYSKEKCLNNMPWFILEDVLIKGITLPKGVQEAIVRKTVASHEVEEFVFKIAREEKEAERKRIEALSIRNFQEIISNTMSDTYLKWRGIEATLALANSPNAKIVVIGNNKNGMPLIFNAEDGPTVRGHAGANQSTALNTAAAPPSSASTTVAGVTAPAATVTPSSTVATNTATTATQAAAAPAPSSSAATLTLDRRGHSHSAAIPVNASQDKSGQREGQGRSDRAPAKPRDNQQAKAESDQSWWDRFRAGWAGGG